MFNRLIFASCLLLLPTVVVGQVSSPAGPKIQLREVRTYSGSGNSPHGWGAVGVPLLRISYSDYPDGIGEVLREGANPRMVSHGTR